MTAYPEAPRYLPTTAADLDGWVGPVEWSAVSDIWRRGVWGYIGESSGNPVWGLATAGDGHDRGYEYRLDTTRPEVIDRLMRVHSLPEWQRAYPGIVACSVMRVRAGSSPVVKLLPEWKRLHGRAENWSRTGDNDGRYLHVTAGGNMSGTTWDTDRVWIPWWRWNLSRFESYFITVAGGQSDTADAAKSAADTAALDNGHALHNGDHILLPYGPGDVRRWSTT